MEFFLVSFLVKKKKYKFFINRHTCLRSLCTQLCPTDLRKCYLDILKWMLCSIVCSKVPFQVR